MLADTSHIRTVLIRIVLMVVEEMYPLASSSSSNHWKKFLNGAGDTTPVDKEGCP